MKTYALSFGLLLPLGAFQFCQAFNLCHLASHAASYFIASQPLAQQAFYDATGISRKIGNLRLFKKFYPLNEIADALPTVNESVSIFIKKSLNLKTLPVYVKKANIIGAAANNWVLLIGSLEQFGGLPLEKLITEKKRLKKEIKDLKNNVENAHKTPINTSLSLSIELPLKEKELAHISNQLAIWTNIVQHEYNHIISNDALKSTIAQLGIPLVTYMLTYKIASTMWPLKSLYTFNLFSLVAMPCLSIPLRALNNFIFKAYSRHLEQKADDATPDTYTSLNGGVMGNYLTALVDKENCTYYENEIRTNGTYLQKIGHFFYTLLYTLSLENLNNTHPSSLSRMQKYQARLAHLENKN